MNPALVRFMRAWVAMCAKEGRSVESWPIGQVVDAFCLLEPPPISFEAWSARLNAMCDAEQEPAQDRTGELNGSSVLMAESAKDLQRDGILSIKDA